MPDRKGKQYFQKTRQLFARPFGWIFSVFTTFGAVKVVPSLQRQWRAAARASQHNPAPYQSAERNRSAEYAKGIDQAIGVPGKKGRKARHRQAKKNGREHDGSFGKNGHLIQLLFPSLVRTGKKDKAIFVKTG
ncbi:MAG TPA: hypothetical protein DF364_01810 [Ruminococcaceae bacterium]|nr:hypothetical protein [Oscillospiraceae bacterium]HCU32572.1 hypothetical protein [Oscillospiraceae bacterium]